MLVDFYNFKLYCIGNLCCRLHITSSFASCINIFVLAIPTRLILLRLNNKQGRAMKKNQKGQTPRRYKLQDRWSSKLHITLWK